MKECPRRNGYLIWIKVKTEFNRKLRKHEGELRQLAAFLLVNHPTNRKREAEDTLDHLLSPSLRAACVCAGCPFGLPDIRYSIRYLISFPIFINLAFDFLF